MPSRGGSTAIAGLALVLVGVVSALTLTVGESQALGQNLLATWVAAPASTIMLLFALLSLTTIVAAIGVLLVAIGRWERNREEELILDPLSYPPVRRHWVRGLVWLVPVLAIILLPGLYVIPVAHSFGLELPVGTCTPGSQSPAESVSLPSGAVLVYEWRSSDGNPVGKVVAPEGPDTSNVVPYFLNSSLGHSLVVSNGSALTFAACDFGSPAGNSAGRTVLLSGTYYIGLL